MQVVSIRLIPTDAIWDEVVLGGLEALQYMHSVSIRVQQRTGYILQANQAFEAYWYWQHYVRRRCKCNAGCFGWGAFDLEKHQVTTVVLLEAVFVNSSILIADIAGRCACRQDIDGAFEFVALSTKNKDTYK